MVAARFLAAPDSHRSSTGTRCRRNSGRLPFDISANMACSRSGAVMFETNRTNCDPVRSWSDLAGMARVNSSTRGSEPLSDVGFALRGRKTSNGKTANGMRLKQLSRNVVAPRRKRPVIVLCPPASVQMSESDVKLCPVWRSFRADAVQSPCRCLESSEPPPGPADAARPQLERRP